MKRQIEARIESLTNLLDSSTCGIFLALKEVARTSADNALKLIRDQSLNNRTFNGKYKEYIEKGLIHSLEKFKKATNVVKRYNKLKGVIKQ